jgi:glycosyltransferase involved in cell wall biosynthesis
MQDIKRKKILLVVRHPVGGIRTYFKYIYSQDVFNKYDFTIVSPDSEVKSLLKEIFEADNYQYVPCNDSVSLLKASWKCLLGNKFDLVHSHGFTAGVLIVLANIFSSVPHLMTAHDVLLNNQFVGIKGGLKKFLLTKMFNRLDAIHAVSNDGAENLLEKLPKLKHQKIRTILHGIDVNDFYGATATKINDHDLEGAIRIGFFGRFMSQKGFLYLVDAIEIIKENRLSEKKITVLAFGWGGFVREEFDDIKKRGLDKYIKLMPFTDNMPGAIKSVDIVAMPSLWEACGLLAMEALVVGTPIIGTDCIGLREVLNGSPAKTVPKADANALALAIVNEISENRTAEFQAYAEVAKDRFSHIRPAMQLEQLYSELIQGSVT